jgi:hypothetical protein
LPPAQVREQLQLVTDELPLPLHEKLAFLQEARHAFGRTALMLSGGGTHGSFHLGVRGESSLGDAKSSLGDARSSLGDAESSLGDA